MNLVTVHNKGRTTITFIGKGFRAAIPPGQHGELPDTVVPKYIGVVEVVESNHKPIKPTPKRSKPAGSEDIV